MTTIAELCATRPDPTHGHPVGWLDWRLAVEMLLPADVGSLVGRARVGTARVGQLAWYDITGDVRGLEFTRGADQMFGRPRTGHGEITVASRTGKYSTWNVLPGGGAIADAGSWLEPGLVVRVGVHRPTLDDGIDWVPLITGEVEDVATDTAGKRADQWTTISFVETTARLAGDEPAALPNPTNNNERAIARIRRILNLAGWPYGNYRAVEWANGNDDLYPLVATTLPGDRLGEVYLAADSAGVVAFSDRTGRLLIRPRADDPFLDWAPDVDYFAELDTGRWIRSPGGPFDTPYVADSIQWRNDGEGVINDVVLSIATDPTDIDDHDGVWRQSDVASIRRLGRKTARRTDLRAVYSTGGFKVYEILAGQLLQRARLTRRVESLELDAAQDPARVFPTLFGVEPQAVMFVTEQIDGVQIDATNAVRSFTHRITPRGVTSSVTWTATVYLDTLTTDITEI